MKSNIEKRSKHKLNVYQWIIKVIDSCVTYKQVVNCENLIYNYRRQYDLMYRDNLYYDLEIKIYHKKQSLN